jgi:3-hydroxyacyl-CoA dehydrogenase
MALERELFMQLMMGEQSAAQRYAFFAERQVWKIPDMADDTPTRPIRTVGIVGAGVMGGGLAMTFANAGLPVALVARRQESLERCLATVRRNYGRSRSMTPDAVEQRMSLIVAGLDIQSLADCDLVIEAVPDTMDVKIEVLGRISPVVRPDALIASNTSFLDIDALAGVVDGPERFLGLHFFSPANVMKLVEVVRGRRTAPDVIATAMRLARTIGKVGVLSGVCRGFIGNRMLAQRTRKSLALLVEGASPGQVDKVLTDFGLPMGPFAMSDLAGLDIAWNRATSTGSTVREVLNEMGRHGQKAGAGYYDYDADGKPAPSPVVEQAILDLARRRGVIRRQIADQEILERCLYPMVNEGAKILDEGIALRAGDIDVVWLNGYGWPRYRGGPMWWGGRLGLPKIVEALRRYEAAGHGDLKPAALLERLAGDGRTFQDL